MAANNITPSVLEKEQFKMTEATIEKKPFMQVANEKEELNRSSPPNIHQSYPWFLVRDGKYLERQLFFSISENRFYKKSIPEMYNKEICTHTNGWLVLKDVESLDLCLLNLSSKEVMQLPRLETITDCSICILSSPPSDPNNPCHVFFIDADERIFYFCQPGEDKFDKREFRYVDDSYYITYATMFEGKLVFLLFEDALFTAEFVGSELRFMEFTGGQIAKPSPPEIFHFKTYLIESCGELLYVHKMFIPVHRVYGFLIFRADPIEKMWMQVKSIGERTIFLSNDSGISCIATEQGVNRNSIYFTKSDDRFLYIFDLEDCSISKFLPCSIASYRGIELDWVMI